MKIRAYTVRPHGTFSLSVLLSHLQAQPLNQRESGGIRVEYIQPTKNLWYLDVVKPRTSGPARYSKSAPTKGFALNGDAFAEEAAAIFDTKKGILVSQYNHYGPRINSIHTCVSGLARKFESALGYKGEAGYFSLDPIMRSDMAAALKTKKLFRNLTFQTSAQTLSSAAKQKGVGLASAIGKNLPQGAETVRLEIRASRAKASSLDSGWTRDFIGWLKGQSDIDSLNIRAKEGLLDKVEELDLIDAYLQTEVILQVGADGRYPRTDRLQALYDARDAWVKAGKL